jgi:hypothetical protein
LKSWFEKLGHYPPASWCSNNKLAIVGFFVSDLFISGQLRPNPKPASAGFFVPEENNLL